MIKEDFLKKVALTLEVSLRIAEDWLLKLEPDNKEEIDKLDSFKAQIHELLVEVGTITQGLHQEYESNKGSNETI